MFQFRFDNYEMTAEQTNLLKETITRRLYDGVVLKMSERPSYYPGQDSPLVSISLTEANFLVGQHADDDDKVRMYIASSNKPGNWLCWDVERVNISAYVRSDASLRGFDVQIIVSPRHDSSARFAKALVMIRGRVGLDSDNVL